VDSLVDSIVEEGVAIADSAACELDDGMADETGTLEDSAATNVDTTDSAATDSAATDSDPEAGVLNGAVADETGANAASELAIRTTPLPAAVVVLAASRPAVVKVSELIEGAALVETAAV
jgi:hypothetical protein